MSRAIASLFFALTLLAGGTRADAPPGIPMTGTPVPELSAFDRAIAAFMEKWKIPGGALGVVKDGRLVLARGYGLADVEAKQPVAPDALFRIASVSKPVTAAAILVLSQRGQLDLDAPAFALLAHLTPLPGATVDPRINRITVRHLLQHTAGFDRQRRFDPMFRPQEIARAAGVPPPPDAPAIIRFMLGQPLDFDPGSRYAYSNFGYCVLGRIIEQVTGRRYEEAVKELVLGPAGIRRMRLARTRASERADGEVRYYSPEKPVASVFPDVAGPVPWPYGAFCVEAMDSHGGWIASTADLLRLATALDGARKPRLLRPETVQLMEARPDGPVAAGQPTWYGLGWKIRPVGQGYNWWHAGVMPGTASILVRTHHGLAWAAVFNLRASNEGPMMAELDQTIWKAVAEVRTWPGHDWFTLPSPASGRGAGGEGGQD